MQLQQGPLQSSAVNALVVSDRTSFFNFLKENANVVNKAAFLLEVCVIAWCASKSQAQNPIFGTDYDQLKVKYDDFPDAAKRLCARVDNQVKYYWVYAHYKSADSEYYIVMDKRPDPDGYDFATAIWIHGSKCTEDKQSADWTLSGVPPKNGYGTVDAVERLPGLDAHKISFGALSDAYYYTFRSAHEEEILRGLIKDGIQRAVRARGSDASFRKQACSARIMSKHSKFDPMVLQELNAYCTVEPTNITP
jgi:hypothetical protein